MSKVKQWAEETAEKKVDDIIYKLKELLSLKLEIVKHWHLIL